MREKTFEVRVCESCGLRYPVLSGHPHGIRCPGCAGQTRVMLTRELVLEPDRRPLPSPKKNLQFSVLLDNIRSAWNVGSVLRSAEGFGFTHAYLCGITPTPELDAVQKTSLGAEDSATWSHHKDALKLVKGLKAEGWKTLALEEDSRARKIGSISNGIASEHQVVLIIGNEIGGVDPEILNLCDEIYFIPMSGEKKSFNVAIAFGIAAYALMALPR